MLSGVCFLLFLTLKLLPGVSLEKQACQLLRLVAYVGQLGR